MTEPGSFQRCPVPGPEAMALNETQERCFPMNIRKLPPVRVTEPWHWFSRGDCRVSITGNVQKPRGQVPGQLAPGGHKKQGAWTRELQEVPSKYNHSVILTLFDCVSHLNCTIKTKE